MTKSKNIISITDIIENKVRKQKELDDYNVRLEELQRQKFWLEKEIQMAEFIIAAVQNMSCVQKPEMSCGYAWPCGEIEIPIPEEDIRG
ncbi:hypothetical protein CMI47_07810 [Candidatus Pacearchaeota archaeon]|nr:hypothetical protein [Candidatus Pacearchaeota archaeon]|tara:strand:- start:1783 stop:2049 length:267 start_codon:yes stop_codon:yes gene_type:complete